MKKPDLHSESSGPQGSALQSAEENACIRRIQDGAADEYRTLVDRYKQRIFTLVVRQVGDRSEAEDLTQEIFVKAYMNLKKFRFESSFLTWLLSISFNHLNSYFSSRGRKQRASQVSLELVREELVASASADSHDLKRLISRLREALGDIPPKLRTTFVLVALDGRSYEEVAGTLGIPLGTVRSRVNQARVLLRSAMGRFR